MKAISLPSGKVTRLSLLVALVLGLALVAAPSARADVSTNVRVDAHVQQSRPDTNYRSATTLSVNNSSTARRYAFVKVDHPTAPPGETIAQYVLRVHVTGEIPASARLYADLVGSSWGEGNVTYNKQPEVLATAPGPSQELVPGWNLIPIEATLGATQSYRIRTNVASLVRLSSQENVNGNGPVSVLVTGDQPPPIVQTPTAIRASATCGALDVDYATGASDDTSSTFVTTVDGVQVDSEVVSAPSGTGGHGPVTLTEDSSGGSADVVVTANGAVLLFFTVDTDCVDAGSPGPGTGGSQVIGMSAPSDLWSTRVDEVGACGLEARRIFGDLVSDGRSQERTIRQAVSDGMIPVVSYKVPSVPDMIAGQYDSWMVATRKFLSSLGVQTSATFWHEPHGDMTTAEFRSASARFLSNMKAPTVAVGPILNGFLLDNRVADFAAYTSPELLAGWDFLGIDIYQAGSATDPGAGAARGVYNVETWLDGQGFGDMPIVIGEYNGYSAETIAAAGEAILATPEVWMGLVFNSAHGAKGNVLTGSQIVAFKNTKADARALHSPAC